MKFHQEKKAVSSLTIDLELKDSGFQFKSARKSLFASEYTPSVDAFFYYSDLTNQKKKFTDIRSRDHGIQSSLITGLILGSGSFNLLSNKYPEGVAFLIAAIGTFFFLLFAIPLLTKGSKSTMLMTQNGYITIINDDQTDKIVEELYKARNKYLHAKYIEDKVLRDTLNIETLEYLESLGVVNQDESKEIKARMQKTEGSLGFSA